MFSGGYRISRRGGRGPRRKGCGLPRRLRFENFVCQNERIGSLRGGRTLGVPPLDPPMMLQWILLLVFRNKDLYLVITQKLIFWNPADFMKSTQNLIKSDVSTKTLQFGGCREGAMTQDFMKSWVIAPLLHSSNWIILVETFAFIRFWVDFMWNRKTTCKEL